VVGYRLPSASFALAFLPGQAYIRYMNQLPVERRAAIVRCLVEGNSARATARLTGTSRTTVLSLVVELGQMCRLYQDQKLRNLPCKRIQADEVWSFCGAKAKQVRAGAKGEGDVWTWTAICADTKLMVSWLVSTRRSRAAQRFIADLQKRLANRVQLTTDGHSVYVDAVDRAFGRDVDYAMLIKLYAAVPSSGRYSPPVCVGAEKHWVTGDPDPDYVSTSYVERQNLTMRMGNRRFTRLTNAFSRKVENHAYSVDIHFMHYNFCRPHTTLTKAHPFRYPQTPAMAAGLTDHVWTLEEVCALLDPSRPIGG
jgi:IS1 family transposase